jgi:hypothetical protein
MKSSLVIVLFLGAFFALARFKLFTIMSGARKRENFTTAIL